MNENMNKKIEIFSSPTCHFCKDLKAFLDEKNIEYIDYDVSANEEYRNQLVERSQQLGVPVTFIGDEMIIGFDKPKIMELLGITE